MSQATTKIKTRIKSVSGAYKVTSAMKLISNVKLKQWRNKMLSHKDYMKEVEEIASLILAYAKKWQSPYSMINEGANKNLYLIVSSTLGLCGGYNTNIFKVSDAAIKEEDEAIILGGKGISHYENGSFKTIPGFGDYSSISNEDIVKKICKYILNEYKNGKYREIHIIYTEYKNSLMFLAKDYQLLPLKIKDVNDDNYSPIMEPSPKELLDEVIPFYLESIIYSKLLESEVCEQGARSNAMENATKNAEDILQELQIEFNKARQASITQEIIEIVAASKTI